jgi:ABC-2 type transport system ATP-binding protein
MQRGRVIALGAPAELRAGLRAHGLLRLDTSAPLDTMRAVEKIEGISDVAVFGGGLHVTVDDAGPAMERIRRELETRGIDIRRLEPIEPSLEDVFVALIEADERRVA